jgi:hypothetical protein
MKKYFAVDTDTDTYVVPHAFDTEADAYLAAISNGEAVFKRDAGGYMRAEIKGRQVYSEGSYKEDDEVAKADALPHLYRHMADYGGSARYLALCAEYDDAGNIVSVNGYTVPDILAYWRQRV